jgi:hypothetical protein
VSRWQVVARMTWDRNYIRLGSMFVMPMPSGCSDMPPAIRLNQADNISDFHLTIVVGLLLKSARPLWTRMRATCMPYNKNYRAILHAQANRYRRGRG